MPDASLASPALNQQEVASALQPVLASRTFEKTPALRTLLAYLWDHRDDPISEYAIATEALGRTTNFDARTDATVRVQIGRLRQRLERFYEDEGKHCASRINIPLGSHQVQLETGMALQAIAVAEPIVLSPSLRALNRARRFRWTTAAWAGLTVFLASICVYQAYRIDSVQKIRTAPPVPWLWQRFFNNNLPSRVVLPTPIFFSFDISGKKDGHAAMFRDTEINEFGAGSQSPLFRAFVSQAGKPALADNYTVTSDTFASVQLARYLDGLGIHATVNSAADAPMEALDDENVIAVGTWGTLTPLKHYLDRMDFHLSAHESTVRISHRLPGEPAEVGSYVESGERNIMPGVVAFLPGMNGRSHLLLLAGRHTAALVSALTSTVGLDQLHKIWKDKGSPEYFEVIIKAEMRGRVLMRASPVALHPYKSKA